MKKTFACPLFVLICLNSGGNAYLSSNLRQQSGEQFSPTNSLKTGINYFSSKGDDLVFMTQKRNGTERHPSATLGNLKCIGKLNSDKSGCEWPASGL